MLRSGTTTIKLDNRYRYLLILIHCLRHYNLRETGKTHLQIMDVDWNVVHIYNIY